MAELFNCCAAATTSDTFWQMVQSFKEFSLPSTLSIQTSGISPELFPVSILIFFASTAAASVYYCRYHSLLSKVKPLVQRKWFSSNKVNSWNKNDSYQSSLGQIGCRLLLLLVSVVKLGTIPILMWHRESWTTGKPVHLTPFTPFFFLSVCPWE